MPVLARQTGYLAPYAIDIVLALGILIGATVVIQWWAWIVGLGRFKPGQKGESQWSVARAAVELFVKIIDDFKHLLALVVMAVFLATLILVMAAGWPQPKATDSKNLLEGIQVVVASLGGLVGSIIGYYFGESAARRGSGPGSGMPGGGPQAPAPGAPAPGARGAAAPIERSAEPPDLRRTDG
jgi:hypothetical protein